MAFKNGVGIFFIFFLIKKLVGCGQYIIMTRGSIGIIVVQEAVLGIGVHGSSRLSLFFNMIVPAGATQTKSLHY